MSEESLHDENLAVPILSISCNDLNSHSDLRRSEGNGREETENTVLEEPVSLNQKEREKYRSLSDDLKRIIARRSDLSLHQWVFLVPH